MIAIAKVLKPQGVLGQLKVLPFSKTAHSLQTGDRVFIGNDIAGYTETFIEARRQHKRELILTLNKITLYEQAEAFRGGFIALPEIEIGAPEEGRYYIDVLMGMQVVNMEGIHLGVVEDVLELPAHDTLVVRKESKETMIPMVRQFIESIDPSKGVIIVREIEGLMEA